MKFVCDKCQTRYSIGEDRVRGKILKIRCKNCGNVITVREGMDADAASGDAARKRPTTAAPVVGVATAKPVTAPPPPALHEEWYVSIDGVQTGPMSRPEAIKWVASKPFEAELHCWSEGFDDWLSVDKVSHFRNLRKPAAPPSRPIRPKTVPPPVPKQEPPPKPLFASTMAALEKDASGPKPALPASAPVGTLKGTPAVPAATGRVNGSGSAPIPQTAKGTGSGQVPAVTPRRASPSGRFQALKASTGAALADAFEPDESLDLPGLDSATTLDAPAFGFGSTPGAKPEQSRPNDPFAAFDAKQEPAKTVGQALESDDDLSIGEVSRVVKLTDLAPKPKPPVAATSLTGASARLAQTGAVNRVSLGNTAAQPRLSPAELGMNVDPLLAQAAGPSPDESIVARSFAQRHRRGMIALILVGGALLAGVAGVLIYMQSNSTDAADGFGGSTRTIDTSRPEDIIRKQSPQPNEGSGSAVAQKPRWTPRQNPTQNPQQVVEEDPKGLSLKASEVEDMAAKQGEGTKRCYMRAQKGALGFEIAELKKIAVTLTVGKDGVVSSVELSSHATDAFGQCLIARIKGWKFRESPSGGTFRISLAFSS